jgi:hypothetical protein
MYEPYPASGPAQEPPRVQPSRSVLNAVRLMYAGAALEVITLIVALVTVSSLKAAVLAEHPDYTSAQLHNAEAGRTVTLVIGALITTGLWLWMALANAKGLNWARIVAAVFFGINTLDLLLSFFLVHAAATLIVSVIVWLVGLGAIVLMFSRESAPFYRQHAGPEPANRDRAGS